MRRLQARAEVRFIIPLGRLTLFELSFLASASPSWARALRVSSFFRLRMISPLRAMCPSPPSSVGMMTKIGQKKMNPPEAIDEIAQIASTIPTGPATAPSSARRTRSR